MSLTIILMPRFNQFVVSFTGDAIGTGILIENCLEPVDNLSRIRSNLLRLAIEDGKLLVFASKHLEIYR